MFIDMNLTLKIPPPLLLLICAGAMYLLAPLGPRFQPLEGLFWLLLGLGFSLDCAASLLFLRARTSADPVQIDKASRLVTAGIYRLSRNPMYLGLGLLLLAWAARLASPLALLPVAYFFFHLNRWQIPAEEALLRAKFPADYDRYCATTGRWLWFWR